MIPTVEEVLKMLKDGQCTLQQAMAWMEEHITFAMEEAQQNAAGQVVERPSTNVPPVQPAPAAPTPRTLCDKVASMLAIAQGHTFQDRDAWEKVARQLERELAEKDERYDACNTERLQNRAALADISRQLAEKKAAITLEREGRAFQSARVDQIIVEEAAERKRLKERAERAEAALTAATKDAEHFYQLSGRYLEELAAARPSEQAVKWADKVSRIAPDCEERRAARELLHLDALAGKGEG